MSIVHVALAARQTLGAMRTAQNERSKKAMQAFRSGEAVIRPQHTDCPDGEVIVHWRPAPQPSRHR